jgi:hypothetical protein
MDRSSVSVVVYQTRQDDFARPHYSTAYQTTTMAVINGSTTHQYGHTKANGPTAAQIAAVKAVVRPNLIKQTMLDNRLAYSFGMRVAFSVEMPLVAKRAGYTSLLMNMEHMAIDMQTMSNVCVSCLNVG